MENYLVAAIKSLRPDSEFSFTNNDYSTIHFDVLNGEKPTLAEVNAEIARLKKIAEDKLAENSAAKEALLERLGITAEEAKLLIS